jgi:hypothetical protein
LFCIARSPVDGAFEGAEHLDRFLQRLRQVVDAVAPAELGAGDELEVA